MVDDYTSGMVMSDGDAGPGDEGYYSQDETAAFFYEKAVKNNDKKAQTMLGYICAKGEGVRADQKRAIYWYQLAANQGDTDAQRELGKLLSNGSRDNTDASKGIEYIKRAAADGDVDAIFQLGFAYFRGQGVDEDNDKAASLFAIAADKDHRSAQFYLGACYEKGFGVEQDLKKAAEWYSKAKVTSVTATYRLARLKILGSHELMDIEGGLELLKEAAEYGESDALYLLGTFYFKGNFVPASAQTAEKLFLRAIEKGDEKSYEYLGMLYYYGDKEVERNPAKAIPYLEIAIKYNSMFAKDIIGGAYLTGSDGYEKDIPKAMELLKEPAEYGLASSQACYGSCFMFDESGVKDYKKALYWLEKAADQDNNRGLFFAGLIHLQGDAGGRNMMKAKYYLQKAADNGVEEAKNILNSI